MKNESPHTEQAGEQPGHTDHSPAAGDVHHDAAPITAHTEVPAHDAGHDAHGATGPMDVSGEMFLWTLGTFALMAFVLGKFAWNPILAALEQREQDISNAVTNAETVRQELAAIDDKRSSIIGAADEQAKEIVNRARRAGAEVERSAEDRGREKAAILVENAEREISSARDKAAADLRKESVEAAISLAGKLIGENLDSAKNRKLTERLISQL
jgi:F-type H+-transporting ATPase subunit b